MQTFSTITLFFALSSAVPHALNYFRLHEHAHALALKPLVERDLATANLIERQSLSPNGICRNGFSCAPGMCCSQYGYCGVGPEYCGTGSGGASAPQPSGAPPSYQPGRTRPRPGNPSAAPGPVPSSPASHPPYAPSGAPQPSGSAAAPAPSSAPSTAPTPPTGGGGPGLGNVYKMYNGDGSPSQGWPSQSQWMDFEGMWNANLQMIGMSCSQFQEKNNSPQESADLKNAIQSVGASSGIDPRFILAVVMQESKGCVRVITTDNGVINPGLMQSHDGTGTCNPGGAGAPGSDPCPATQITQMIQDGTEGTAAGDGLKQTLAQCTGTDIAQKYYQAGVIYNSGNLPQNLDDNTATPCYASDIANRLTGWTTAGTSCTL